MSQERLPQQNPRLLRAANKLARERAKHIGWMKVALSMAQLSKCSRAQYASLILDTKGREVASGRNGKPAGSTCDEICYREGLPPNAPKAKCCLHSEQNALIFASYPEIQGGTFYVTGMPCEDCALLIAQSGVNTLVCVEDPRGYPGLEVLERYGFITPAIDPKIRVIKLTRQECGLSEEANDA